MGFTSVPVVANPDGELLPHPFTVTRPMDRGPSVRAVYSLRHFPYSPFFGEQFRLGTILALRSPDFPLQSMNPAYTAFMTEAILHLLPNYYQVLLYH